MWDNVQTPTRGGRRWRVGLLSMDEVVLRAFWISWSSWSSLIISSTMESRWARSCCRRKNKGWRSTITNKTKKITIHANLTRTSGSFFGETLYTFNFLSCIFIYVWVFCTLFSCSWLFFFLVNCFHWILSCPFNPWCGYGEFQIFFETSKVLLTMAFE